MVFRTSRESKTARAWFTEDEIKDVVLTGRTWIQGKGARGGVRWAFEKIIDGDTLRVAGEVKGNGIYVVTAFWVGK